MNKIITKYRRICITLISVMVFNLGMAAEFVVQTDLDTGGDLIIAEISPGVYSINTLRSAIEQANDEVNFPGHDTIRFDENIINSDPSTLVTHIILNHVGDQFNVQGQVSDSAFGIDSAITIQGTPAGGLGLPIYLDANLIMHYSKVDSSGMRHFQVNNGGRLRLIDLNIGNGNTPTNSAGRGGSVLVLNNGKLEIDGCFFIYNKAANGGALAFQTGSMDTLIKNSGFIGNSAGDQNQSGSSLGQGGAIYADLSNNLISIENSYFIYNKAEANGGVAYFNRPFKIINSTLNENMAIWNGGALYVDDMSEFTISNSIFNKNTSEMQGGAIYTRSESTSASHLFNSTLANNEAGYILSKKGSRGGVFEGGAIFSSIPENLAIHNSIIATNEASRVANDVTAELLPESSYNLIGVAGDISGISHNNNGNLIGTLAQPIEPGLILENTDNHLTVKGLESSSPAVNSGINAQVVAAGLIFDINGNDRIVGQKVDRGAIESDVLFYNNFE